MNNLDGTVDIPVTTVGIFHRKRTSPVEHSRERPSRLHVRLRAAAWIVSVFPPFVANRFRMMALRASGIKLGRGSIFWGVPTVIGQGSCSDFTIGAECGFNVGCFFELDAPIQIGDRVRVGHEVMVLTTGYTAGDSTQRAGTPFVAPVVIEDGVWVGARCVIMPGVTIGAGSVIGAMAVVEKDVPPNTLIMGTQMISLARWR